MQTFDIEAPRLATELAEPRSPGVSLDSTQQHESTEALYRQDWAQFRAGTPRVRDVKPGGTPYTGARSEAQVAGDGSTPESVGLTGPGPILREVLVPDEGTTTEGRTPKSPSGLPPITGGR